MLQIRSVQTVPLEGNGADGSWGDWNELGKNPKAAPLTERKWWQFTKHPKKLKPAERSKRFQESGDFVFKGYNYDVHDECPLFQAISRGDSKMVTMLLDNGANPNVFTKEHYRPLNAALVKGNPDIVRLLIKHGADVNAVDSKYHRTALWWCENLYHHRDIEDILREADAKM